MRSLFLVLSFFILSSVLQAKGEEEEYEWENMQVHSDLPLYDFDWEEFWPRHYVDDDPGVIGGCASRVSFGDWEFTPHPNDRFGETWWYRFSNYGVFHCAANIWGADERAELETAQFDRGFFALIGIAKKDDRKHELWVFQQGLIPGSDYLLLSREAEIDGLIQEFDVLQSRCPKSNVREAKNLDVWSTQYCAINSRRELLRFAKRMLNEPPLGTLRLVPDEKGPETEASDPSDVSD